MESESPLRFHKSEYIIKTEQVPVRRQCYMHTGNNEAQLSVIDNCRLVLSTRKV